MARPLNREKTIFSTNGAGNTEYSHVKNKTVPLPNMIYKNSKRIKNLNLKTKTINLLVENIRENLHDIGFGNDFLDMKTKMQATTTKINKLAFMNI